MEQDQGRDQEAGMWGWTRAGARNVEINHGRARGWGCGDGPG